MQQSGYLAVMEQQASDVIEQDPDLKEAPTGEVGLRPHQVWIIHHDRSIAFALIYIAVTVVLSVMVSYFWLFAMVAIHFGLEWLKKGYIGYRPGLHRVAWSTWDVRFDIALSCMALALLTFTGVTAGAAGAHSLGRLGAIGARFSAVTQGFGQIFGRMAAALRIIGVRIVDLFFSARVALFRKADMSIAARREAAVSQLDGRFVVKARAPRHFPWHARPSLKDWLVLGVVVTNGGAVALAPLVTGLTYPELGTILSEGLHPWP